MPALRHDSAPSSILPDYSGCDPNLPDVYLYRPIPVLARGSQVRCGPVTSRAKSTQPVRYRVGLQLTEDGSDATLVGGGSRKGSKGNVVRTIYFARKATAAPATVSG